MNKDAINILAVDDDVLTLNMLRKSLTHLGFQRITTCRSGADALTALDAMARPVDVILLDMKMPEMDGVEFTRHLVERAYTGSILLISGEGERLLASAEKLLSAHEMNILGYLTKPIAPKDLAAKLSQVAGGAKVAPAAERKSYSSEQLHTAIGGGQLVNYYQPIVDVASAQPLGLEVLARWQHPEDGLVPPDLFIPLAEDSGLIHALTETVIDSALAQLGEWRAQNITLPLSINLSMENLAHLDFADQLMDKVKAANIAPEQITLEVTESRAMKDPRIALDNLMRLRLKGFVLAIDDFGTGHASLAQLRDIPFDKFKLDQSFVHNAGNNRRVAVMFESSLHLARDLEMKVVAEGVENSDDWHFVQTSDCSEAQGYFIAHPMPADKVPAWLAYWQKRAPGLAAQASSTANADAPGRAAASPPAPAAKKPLEKGTALIVDDHAFQRKVQSLILREEGFKVELAESGRKAREILTKLKPQLILLDIELPDGNGLDLLREWRKTSKFKHTPVVVVSAHGSKTSVEESLSAGANSFLLKPYDRKTLLQRVYKAIRQ